MALGPGSIAFTGFNADAADNLQFVTLTDIAAGTVIHFTDNEWTGSAFNTGESTWDWTATGDIAAGTLVTLDNLSNPATASSNLGTVSFTDTTSPGIDDTNEAVYAYVGNAGAPTFLTAIAYSSFAYAGGTLTGTGLTQGTNAIATPGTNQADTAEYTGPRATQANFSNYGALINDFGNWTGANTAADDSHDGVAPDVPFSPVPFAAGAALHEGSIAFTGFNADGADNLQFVTLTNITAGTVIHFTDNAWTGSAFASGESVWDWTASSDIAAGSLITMDNLSSPATATSNHGTINYTDTTSVGIDNTNEAVYAYTGDAAAPSFLAAIANNGYISPAGVLTGTGLKLGTTAVGLAGAVANADTAEFNGQRGGLADFSNYLQAINTGSKWIAAKTAADDSQNAAPPHVPFFDIDFTAGSQLGGGSIAFTAFNADGGQNLAFAALTNIAAGTVIYFSNDGWNGSSFTGGGSTWNWTATSDIAAGAIVTLDNLHSGTASSNLGTIAFTEGASADLSQEFKSIYAYIGASGAPTEFLTAFGLGTAFNALVGTGLVAGTTAMDASQLNPLDIGAYAGAHSGKANFSDYGALINSQFNWAIQASVTGGSNDGTKPDLPLSTAPFFTTGQNPQVVSLAADVSHAEGNSGTTLLTFTVSRTGGTTGDVSFSGRVLGPGPNFTNLATADDFGGAFPTFNGTIPAGSTSTTFTIAVSGDTLFEPTETFTVELQNVSNPGASAITLGTAFRTGTITNDDAQPTTVHDGETYNAPFTLSGNAHLVVEHGGTIDVGGAALVWSGTGANIVIDNSGTIATSGTVSSGTTDIMGGVGTPGGALTFNNLAGGLTSGDFDPVKVASGSSVTLNNYGTMTDTTGTHTVDFHDATKNANVTTVINNYAGGVITQGDDEGGADTMRPGVNTVINNYGKIFSVSWGVYADGNPATGGDAVDYQSNAGGLVHNYTGALIEGSHHAVTGKLGLTVINDAGATLHGDSGSAVNIDNNATVAQTVFVTNHGTMIGDVNWFDSDSDGDAIDTDGLLQLDNYSLIEALGANGTHDGGANVSEGLAIGGGVVNNYLGATIYGYGRAIQVDNSAEGPAFAATTIYNEGTIQGDGHGPQNFEPGSDVGIFLLGREAIDIVGTFADTITNKGQIIGGIFTDGGDDTFNAYIGSTSGKIDLGDGDDTIHLLGTGTGSLGTFANVENLDVDAGTWSIASVAGLADIDIANGAVVTSALTLTGTQHLTIEQGGALSTSSTSITWVGTGSAPVIDNYGLIQSAGSTAIVSSSPLSGTLTVNNHVSGQILDSLNFNGTQTGTAVDIENDGLMQGAGTFALRIARTGGGSGIVTNSSTGVITSTNAHSDVISWASNTIFNNSGKIVSVADTPTQNGGSAIEFSSGFGNTVHNFAGGLIEGSHHAVSGKVGVTVVNDAGGVMVGRNGSAVNIDNDASVGNTVFVTNHGEMDGKSAGYADSDGDAIDTDGLLQLDNYGLIQGLGANGTHDGGANVSEGIAIGGGVVNNYAGATIYGYGRAFQVDNSAEGPALAATTIYNEGTIQGDGHGPQNFEPGSDVGIVLAGREAIDIVGTFADTITNKGSIIGGIFTDGGDDIFNAYTGSSESGPIDLGSGNDTLNLYQGTGAGGIGQLANVEHVNDFSGDWTLGSEGFADVTFESGAQTLRLDAATLTDGHFDGTLKGFDFGDTLDLKGIGLGTAATIGVGNVLTVAGGGISPVTLQLDPAQDFTGLAFRTGDDGAGGTLLTLDHVAVAQDDSASTTVGHTINLNLLGNDTDADNDILNALIKSQPTHGVLTHKADGTFDYTALSLGTDTFTYAANDGAADSNIATVTISIGSSGADTFDFSSSSTNTTKQVSGGVTNVSGGSGNDTIGGNATTGGTLSGGAGNDSIVGGNGNDLIIGGAGNDQMYGRGGDDTFVFRPGFGHDTIKDFQVGSDASHHDTLDLEGLGFTSIADILSHTDAGPNAVIHSALDPSDTITLNFVSKDMLHTYDFLV